MARWLSVIVFALTLVAAGPALAGGASAGDPGGAVNAGTSGDAWANGAAQPNWNVSDKISPGMSQILSQVLIDFSSYTPKGACPSAAANTAWNTLADAANAGPLNAFLDAIKGSLKGIQKVATFGADPSAAADMLDAGALVDAAIVKAKSMAEGKGDQYLKDKIKEAWKGKPVEVLRRSASRGGCDTVLIAIWDRANETYEITIYGDCHCNLVPTWGGGGTVMLKTFAVQLKGRVVPAITDDGVLMLNVGFPKISVAANCDCLKNRSGVAIPPTGGGGIPVPPTGGGGGTSAGPAPAKPDAKFWRELKTNCQPCQAIVDQIHAAQTARDGMKDEFTDAQGVYDAAKTRGNKDEIAAAKEAGDNLTAREAGLIQLEENLLAKLRACEKEKCPEHASSRVCPPADGELAMTVGSNDKVGSGARARQHAVSTAAGLVGGLLGGGGGGDSASGPALARCKIKDSDMTLLNDPQSGVSLRVAARQNGDQVTVFAAIAASPDHGTFQTAFLQNPQGERAAPAKVDICQLWGEWSVSVSWSQTTTVNDQVVSQQHGGWSQSGQVNVPGVVTPGGQSDGLWRRMGFSNASYGARELALRFDHAGAALQQPLDLVVQVTRPGGNPVTTVPFVVQVSKAAGGALALQGEAMTAAARACLSASAADPGLPACPATVGAPAAGSAD